MDTGTKVAHDLPPEMTNVYLAVERLVRGVASERSGRERDKVAHRENVKKLLLEVVDVNDALERLLANAPASSSDEAADIALSNVRMLQRRFARLFKSWQVEPIASVGLIADPSIHNVLEVESRPDKPHGYIVREVQKGYKFEHEVLRCSIVIAAGNDTEGAN
jgi:molecular chaperone GrpE (heat shock protein)